MNHFNHHDIGYRHHTHSPMINKRKSHMDDMTEEKRRDVDHLVQ